MTKAVTEFQRTYRVQQVQRKHAAFEAADLGYIPNPAPKHRFRLRTVEFRQQSSTHAEQALSRWKMLVRQEGHDSNTSHFSKRYASTATPADMRLNSLDP